MTHPTFQVVFRSEHQDGMQYAELRRLLKRMLRGHGFRCLTIAETTPGHDAVSPTDRQPARVGPLPNEETARVLA